MSKPKAPKTPNPYEQADAESRYNNASQYTPFGNLVYTGPGESGNGYGRYDLNLSPEMQGIQDRQNQVTTGSLDEALRRQSEFGQLPNFLDPNDLQQSIFDKQKGLLDPIFKDQMRSAETFASTRGLPIGGEATTGENGLFTGLNRNYMDSLQRASLDATMGANTQTTANRGQLFNELQALTGGQQAQVPGLANFFTPQGSNISGLFANQTNAQNAAYGAQSQQYNANVGTLGTLATLLLFASSRKIKNSIRKEKGFLKKLKALQVYRWKYNGSDEWHVGPMAEDFQRIFGVGDGKTIKVVDIMGVLMGAAKEAYG